MATAVRVQQAGRPRHGRGLPRRLDARGRISKLTPVKWVATLNTIIRHTDPTVTANMSDLGLLYAHSHGGAPQAQTQLYAKGGALELAISAGPVRFTAV